MSNRHRSAGFWNRIAARYARKPVGDPASYQRKLDQTRRYLTPDTRLFELGCGTGTTALHHAPHVARIDAIDYAPEMIRIATAKAQAAGIENVSFHVSTLEAWPAAPASHDVVLAMSILHLVPDLTATLAKVRALLPVGGRFLSSTVCVAEMPGILPQVLLPIGSALRLLPRVLPLHFETVRQQIAAAGFQIEDSWRAPSEAVIFVDARAV